MREIFYEETASNTRYDAQKPAYMIFRGLAYLTITLSIVWIIVGFFTIDFASSSLVINLIFAIVPAIVLFGCGVLFLNLSDNYCVEYDYVLLNDKLSFSKVICNNRRVNISEIEVGKIEKIGLYENKNYERYKSTPDVKIKILTANKTPINDKKFIYIYTTVNAQKYIFILETTAKLLKNMSIYLNRYAIDEDLF